MESTYKRQRDQRKYANMNGELCLQSTEQNSLKNSLIENSRMTRETFSRNNKVVYF